MKLDDAILEELELGGDGTVREIGDRLARRVQEALYRLLRRKHVYAIGYEGQGNKKTYTLNDPNAAPVNTRLQCLERRLRSALQFVGYNLINPTSAISIS